MRDAGKFLKTLFFAAVAVATILFALPRGARAADKVVVIHAEGDGADAIAKDLRAQLPKGLTTSTGDSKSFDAALGKAGHKGAMGKALDATKTRDKLLEKVRKAAQNAKIDVVVIVRVKKNKKDRTATILVVDPASAALAREDEVTLGAKKAADDSKPVVASVVPALEKFAPAAPEPTPVTPPKKDDKVATKDDEKKDDEKKDDEKKDDDDDKKEEPAGEARKTGEIGSALFVVGAGLELGTRRFTWNQPTPPITNNNRAYTVGFAPMLAINAELYPFAGSKGALNGIGISGSYAQALALQSAAQGGDKIRTNWNRWHVGLRYRIGLGHNAYVAPTIGYGGENFTFSDAPDPYRTTSPTAKYTFIRAGVDVRVPVGPIGIMAGVGYLITSSPSDENLELVSGRYPHMTVDGVDANLGVGIGILKGLEARLGARYTRFFYSMNPEPGDAYVAGGALDQLIGLQLGAAYVY